jgi:protein subunit release factor A
MYQKLAQLRGWKFEIFTFHHTESGGCKDCSFSIQVRHFEVAFNKNKEAAAEREREGVSGIQKKSSALLPLSLFEF